MKATHPILFREVQRFRDVAWVMTLVFGIAALQWWLFLSQALDGGGQMILFAPYWLLFGIGLPALFLWLRLEVTVYPDSVVIRFAPFVNRAIPKLDITGVEAVVYRPLGDFGGWGIRGWGGRVAYNVRGNEGVELTLFDGRRVLIGSRHADALAAAIGGH